MTRLLALAFVAVAALAPAPARAADGPPAGRACHVTGAQSDRVTGEDFWTAELDGGPLATPGAVLSLTCSVHVGNAVHSGPAAAEVSTGASENVVALAPTAVTYPVPYEWALQALCTRATVGATTWYWTGGDWTTDGSAPCPVITTVEDLYSCFLYWGLECFVPLPSIDELACTSLLALRPGIPGVVDVREDGDAYVLGELFWDCPPYQPVDQK